jgi:hypothetical protein
LNAIPSEALACYAQRKHQASRKHTLVMAGPEVGCRAFGITADTTATSTTRKFLPSNLQSQALNSPSSTVPSCTILQQKKQKSEHCALGEARTHSLEILLTTLNDEHIKVSRANQLCHEGVFVKKTKNQTFWKLVWQFVSSFRGKSFSHQYIYTVNILPRNG